jgi:hypothetical protein
MNTIWILMWARLKKIVQKMDLMHISKAILANNDFSSVWEERKGNGDSIFTEWGSQYENHNNSNWWRILIFPLSFS